ncbi:MAG: SDR family oxidoreductase [Bacilli bacterium]|nr:SDR family oxidoreductase [Bacilli bacterium]
MNCLITGASIGIGQSLALKLAGMNYNLMLTYCNNENLCLNLKDYIINNYDVKCVVKKLDLRDEDNIKNIIDEFKNELGNLDILVNNASFSCDNLIEDKTKEEFMDVLDVNLVGTFLMCKYGSRIMNKDSLIINMSSTDGIDTYSIYNIDYAVSKAGIIALTKSLSLILDGIRVVSIAPNWVDTESTLLMNQDYLQSELNRIGQDKLIKVETVVKKIINIIVDNSIASGTIIRIDGEENE